MKNFDLLFMFYFLAIASSVYSLATGSFGALVLGLMFALIGNLVERKER